MGINFSSLFSSTAFCVNKFSLSGPLVHFMDDKNDQWRQLDHVTLLFSFSC